jgi:hypothetical protein
MNGTSAPSQPSNPQQRRRWIRTAERPQRWELQGFGAVEERPLGLWAIRPKCGHDYVAISLHVAQMRLELQAGMCLACWHDAQAFRRALRDGHGTPPDGTPLE